MSKRRLGAERGGTSCSPGRNKHCKITLRLPERYTSDLIYVQEASQAPPRVLTAPITPKTRDLSTVVFVSDLPWVRATAGAGNPVRRDTNYYGQPIRVGARICPKGVWTHAFDDATPADVVVDISQLGVAVFAADAGVENSAGSGTVQFQVFADGALRAESAVLKQGQVHHFRVNVAGARQVTLRVLNGSDGYNCDHAAWGLARFIKTGSADPLSGEAPPPVAHLTRRLP